MKIGILGVSFGLVASPLAFAMEEHEEHPTAPQEETMQDDQGSFNSFDADQEQGATNDGVTTEYEEEEQDNFYFGSRMSHAAPRQLRGAVAFGLSCHGGYRVMGAKRGREMRVNALW